MKPIFIRGENCNLEKLMTALEKETNVVCRRSKQKPLELWQKCKIYSSISAIDCDDNGLTFCNLYLPTVSKEIHCIKDFITAVKLKFPKEKEEFFVNLVFVDRKKLLEEIEKVSSIHWGSGDKPTVHIPEVNFLETYYGCLSNSKISEGKTELTPVQFIEKCAELYPPKFVHNNLEEGDICLVRDCIDQPWKVSVYRGNEKFGRRLSSTLCGVSQKQVKPTGVNVHNILKGEIK